MGCGGALLCWEWVCVWTGSRTPRTPQAGPAAPRAARQPGFVNIYRAVRPPDEGLLSRHRINWEPSC